ncbi:MAG: tRNA 2-thiocytidine biosynthesis protein TtcA, partial [Oleiphilaceae bacterium]
NIKKMLHEWEQEHPSRIESIFGSLQNVAPSQLADTQLFDFETLKIDRSGERKPYDYDLNQTVSSSRPKSEENMVQILEIAPR